MSFLISLLGHALCAAWITYILFKANKQIESTVIELMRLRRDVKILNGRILQLEK